MEEEEKNILGKKQIEVQYVWGRGSSIGDQPKDL